MIAIAHNMVACSMPACDLYAYIDRVRDGARRHRAMNSKRAVAHRLDHTALVQGKHVRDYTKWDDQPYSLATCRIRLFAVIVSPRPIQRRRYTYEPIFRKMR